MMGLNIGMPITWIVIGLIGAIIIFVLWPIQNNAGDSYLLTYINHCEASNGERFTNLYEQDLDEPDNVKAGTAELVIEATGGTAKTCDTVTALEVAKTYVSEHGVAVVSKTAVSAGDPIAGSEWNTPTALQMEYNGLSKLLISVAPIIQVAGFFVFASINAFMARGAGAMGFGGLTQVVLLPVLSLIIMIIQLIVAPFLMDFASDAFIWISNDRLEILKMFGQIVKLVFSFFPVVFNASLLGGIGYQVIKARGQMRGRSSSMAYA